MSLRIVTTLADTAKRAEAAATARAAELFTLGIQSSMD